VKIIDYVIIGAGQAGIYAAQTLLNQENKSKITIIDEDPDSFYYRAALKYMVKKRVEEKELNGTTQSFFKDKKINKIVQKVSVIKPSDNSVILEDNTTLHYKKLLIATGGHSFIPQIPGTELEGVYPQRTLEDTRRICEIADKGKYKKCLILGAGVLGTELAESLIERGVEVELFSNRDKLVPRMLDSRAAEIVADLFKKNGVKIHYKTSFSKIIEDENKKVRGVKTTKGEIIDCDGVFICTGMRRNTELAKNAGLNVERGVITNKFLQTSDPNIFAAGDVVEIVDDNHSHHLIDLWGPAGDMGKIAAQNMINESMPIPYNIGAFHAYTIFWKHNCHVLGDFGPKDITGIETLIYDQASSTTHNYYKMHFKDNHIVGVLSLGEARDPIHLQHIISQQISISPNISKKEILERGFDYERILYAMR